jgi:hypothetical protein
MKRNPVNGQLHADAGSTRVRVYPCAIARGSWLVGFVAMTHKLQPRRLLRTS